MTRRRVVVTGMGAVSAAGQGVARLWSACIEGRSALQPLRLSEAALGAPPLGGVFQGTLPENEERSSAFALAAAAEALREARLEGPFLLASGIALGTCLGGALEGFRWIDDVESGGASLPRVPFPEPGGLAAPALRVAAAHGVSGPVIALSSACSSGLSAVIQATACIRRGEVDMMIAVGVDALSLFVVSGFLAMGALTSTRVRPFDRRRDGMALGEGSGVLILEERTRALNRGAPIRAEILGAGTAADARNGVTPLGEGDGLVRAMTSALRAAGRRPGGVDFITAQGSGTRYGDRSEFMAIKRLFGADAALPPVTSFKPNIGHALGAAGTLGAILCVKAIEESVLPPTMNSEEPADDCDLDIVREGPRARQVQCALTLSSGFSGHNAAMLIGSP